MIGLILPGTLKYCPYVQYYIKALTEADIPYEILSWDKVGLNEDVAHAFRYLSRDSHIVHKTIGYLMFRRWVIRICRQQQYDKLIVFTIAPALLLGRFLLQEYKNKYYLDIRDDTILRKMFGKQIGKLVNGACGIISSSREFDNWISRESLICHNADPRPVKEVLEMNAYQAQVAAPMNGVHRIMFAGALNEWAINRELVKQYANDPNFFFVFHAPEADGIKMIREDCHTNQIKNVAFFGRYKKEEIYGMYRNEADWVNIIRCESVVNRNALPNKLYDAMIAGVPVIVLSHNKAVCDYVLKYQLGLVFDSLEDMKDKFLKKAAVFDYARFTEGRKNFLREVLDASEEFEKRIVNWAKE